MECWRAEGGKGDKIGVDPSLGLYQNLYGRAPSGMGIVLEIHLLVKCYKSLRLVVSNIL